MNIEHVAIWTRDLEALRAFYVKYFDAQSTAKYSNPSKEYTSYFLSFASGARLELMHSHSVPESKDDPYKQFTGFVHMAIAVGTVAAVDALTARLADDGVEVLDGPRKTGDGYYESVILDPDSNRIEITSMSITQG